jgi:hypothetical protein
VSFVPRGKLGLRPKPRYEVLSKTMKMKKRFYLLLCWLSLFSTVMAQTDGSVRAIEQQRREKDQAFLNGKDSPLLDKAKKNFHGLPYFPVNLKYRFEGVIRRYDKRETFDIIASDGRERKTLRYGYFEFSLDGKIHRLQVYKLLDLAPQYRHLLFIPFLDATSGRESYGGGRYLDLEERSDNRYVLDFNLAYNPLVLMARKAIVAPFLRRKTG